LIRQIFKSYGYFIVISIIGSAIALAHYFSQSQIDHEIQEEHFKFVLEQYGYSIQNQLENKSEIVESLRALFLTRRFVSRKDFLIYSYSILKRHLHVFTTAWIPKVSVKSAQKLIRNARTDGLSDYRISSLGNQNESIDRDLLPVLYLESLDSNSELLGVDLGSDLGRFSSLQGLAVSNKTLMSDPILPP
jgi:CHASE1-domain containing sensor protein